MRKLLLGVCLALLRTESLHAQEEIVDAFHFLGSPPTIDGMGDDDAWWGLEAITLDDFFTLGEALEGEDDLSAEIKLGYDNDNLYFWAQVSDDVLIDAASEGNCNWDDDSIELYIDAQNLDVERYVPWENEDFPEGVPAYQFTAIAGDRPDSFCNEIADENHFMEDDTTSTFRWGINSYDGPDVVTRYSQGMDTSVSLVTEGSSMGAGTYTLEAAIPWGALEFTPVDIRANGNEFGFGIAINDDDNIDQPANRNTQMMWQTENGELWHRSDVFPSVELGPDTGMFNGCDVNRDGTCDAVDIDEMSQMVLDGTKRQEDRTNLIENSTPNGFNTYIGDSNLDGQFDEQDIVVGFIAGDHLTGRPAGWAEGDWDGNLVFDDQDFVAAFIAGGYLQGARSSSAVVPEPSSLMLLAIGLFAFVRCRS